MAGRMITADQKEAEIRDYADLAAQLSPISLQILRSNAMMLLARDKLEQEEALLSAVNG